MEAVAEVHMYVSIDLFYGDNIPRTKSSKPGPEIVIITNSLHQAAHFANACHAVIPHSSLLNPQLTR